MYLKVKAHQFIYTKLTLNLKLMCSTLNHLFGVVAIIKYFMGLILVSKRIPKPYDMYYLELYE
jgi:hypothetical protein